MCGYSVHPKVAAMVAADLVETTHDCMVMDESMDWRTVLWDVHLANRSELRRGSAEWVANGAGYVTAEAKVRDKVRVMDPHEDSFDLVLDALRMAEKELRA